MTYWSGTALMFILSGMYLYSYFVYETETGLDQSTILNEAIAYCSSTVIAFYILLVYNKDFQRYYQNIYSDPPYLTVF